jgi:hypothetical protein
MKIFIGGGVFAREQRWWSKEARPLRTIARYDGLGL